MVVSEKGELLGKGEERRRRREWMTTLPRANSSRIKKTGGGGRGESCEHERMQIAYFLRDQCKVWMRQNLPTLPSLSSLPPNRNGKLIWTCAGSCNRSPLPIAITVVYAANATPNEIGIWFLLSDRPFLALPPCGGGDGQPRIDHEGRNIPIGKGREGVQQRREGRVVKMTVPYAFLALSPPLLGHSAANLTR